MHGEYCPPDSGTQSAAYHSRICNQPGNPRDNTMSLKALQPANTQKAKTTAFNVFKRFLDEEEVTLEYVHGCLRADDTGAVVEGVIDKFSYHLAFHTGKTE